MEIFLKGFQNIAVPHVDLFLTACTVPGQVFIGTSEFLSSPKSSSIPTMCSICRLEILAACTSSMVIGLVEILGMHPSWNLCKPAMKDAINEATPPAMLVKQEKLSCVPPMIALLIPSLAMSLDQ